MLSNYKMRDFFPRKTPFHRGSVVSWKSAGERLLPGSFVFEEDICVCVYYAYCILYSS